ncbi:uncharacterized protein LOC143598338 [Bidens hawaiensis]|uniref:uncharacterized protein LOC143598338 n=1 Tax=Bidens hawaiensis TaxID=980011 RepID=UPI00404983EE
MVYPGSLVAYPIAWQGQYHRGDHDGPTIILEAVASADIWMWDALFGMTDANNDIVVLRSSHIFDDIIDRVAPNSSFAANDVKYEYGFYLVDGIYSEWATSVLSFTCPDDDKRKCFKKRHESARKDVERAFGY